MDAIARYLTLHVENLTGAVARLAQRPLGSLMTILVIAIALVVPAGLRVMVDNARALSGTWQGAADFTVYLEFAVDEPAAEGLAQQIGQRNDVERAELLNRSDALVEFRAWSGFGEALDLLDENPLPHAIVVRPAGTGADLDQLVQNLDALEETALVQLDTEWLERLRAILELARRVVDVTTVLLGLAVIVVIGNTIRLEIGSRREEIEIIKLVGGSDGYIRRPFLYLGLCYGVGAGILAALIIVLGLGLVAAPARALMELYGSIYRPAGLSLSDTAWLLGVGGFLGWAGAGIAVARHLRDIEPS
ncbi:MAG: permease-like cell division protein FtsX [Rhodospirillaceae bacterium]|nr:permease-like cell division protein FtsX [Rhodospirillaceae bacterium]